MAKQAKQIHLDKEVIRLLTIKAVNIGSNFKNFVEDHLERLAKTK